MKNYNCKATISLDPPKPDDNVHEHDYVYLQVESSHPSNIEWFLEHVRDRIVSYTLSYNKQKKESQDD